MNTIIVEMKVPEDVFLALQSAGIGRQDLEMRAARDLAVQLYSEGRLSFGKAAKLAGLRAAVFWSILVERGFPVFDYTEEDYKADLQTIKRISDKDSS
jgi:predicted HTH domain antitoxin